MGFNSHINSSVSEQQPMQLKMNKSKKGENSELSDDSAESSLLKALETKNKKLLKNVILTKDEDIITKVLDSVPIPLIPTLIQCLIDLTKKRMQNLEIVLLWFKGLSDLHESAALDNPAIPDLLKSLLKVIDSRMSLKTRLSELQGRLDLLIYQAEGGSQDKDQSSIIVNDVYAESDNDDDDDDDTNFAETLESENVPVWNGEYTDEEMEVDNDIDDGADET